MDASDMSMIMGSGMDMGMGSGGMFTATNMSLARTYWWIILSFTGLWLILRLAALAERRWRWYSCKIQHSPYPTARSSHLHRAYASLIAIALEASYPQLFFSNRYFSWLSPPSLGKCLILLLYWTVITAFLTVGAIIDDAYYYERIAYRAAWISVTQLPFIVLLAGKINILGHIIGSSYDRLSWLHRMVARTLLTTVTIHGGFFITEWWRADFVAAELAMMPMVKYGLGAWAVLVWTTLSSLVPIRRWAYEAFVLQHLVSATVLLWLLSVHVPTYAMYNVWLAVGFWVFDKAAMGVWVTVRGLARRRSWNVGYCAGATAESGGLTSLWVRDVDFGWRAGQSVRVWIPQIDPFGVHPFTVANLAEKDEIGERQVQLVMKAHTGMTERLHVRALPRASPLPLRVFMTGPYGVYPVWNRYESLVLISASTGASFTMPILESVLQDACCARRVEMTLIAKDGHELEPYIRRSKELRTRINDSPVSVRIRTAVTGESGIRHHDAKEATDESDLESATPPSSRGSSEVATVQNDEKNMASSSTVLIEESQHQPLRLHGRPSLDAVIRQPVEKAEGETAVVVCGGRSLTAAVRNYVAKLSDERACARADGVHGIFLHVEEFSL